MQFSTITVGFMTPSFETLKCFKSSESRFTSDLPDAFVIGRCNDISPEHYGGQVDTKVKLNLKRDELEVNKYVAIDPLALGGE